MKKRIPLLSLVPKAFHSYINFSLFFVYDEGDTLCTVDLQNTSGAPFVEVLGADLTVALTKEWLFCYFAVKKTPELSIRLSLTPFQECVLAEIATIGFAKTISYAALAEKVGRPIAFRASAQACGKNPVPLVIPCHRVINKNNTLGGYNKGVAIKQALLSFEKKTSM